MGKGFVQADISTIIEKLAKDVKFLQPVYEEVEEHRGDKNFIKKEPVIDHYGDLVMDVLKREFDRIGYHKILNH